MLSFRIRAIEKDDSGPSTTMAAFPSSDADDVGQTTATAIRKNLALTADDESDGLERTPSVDAASTSSSESGAPAPATFQMRIPSGTWSIGKVSVFVLLLTTVIDYWVCQMHRIDSHELYDALSPDVIRPAFSYQAPSSSSMHRRRTSLGSAAISSVTEVLAPILPFTGGIDLRRDDYWKTSGSWVETIQSVATQVRDAFSQGYDGDNATTASSFLAAIPRGGGINTPGGRVSSQISKKKKARAHASSISAQAPFVNVEEIAEMTLSDMSDVFRYAVECNQIDFKEARFMNGLSPRVRKVVTAMQSAISESRGSDADISVAKPDSPVGATDALAFAAAMRLFAEWRVLRQVPEGYKVRFDSTLMTAHNSSIFVVPPSFTDLLMPFSCFSNDRDSRLG